MRWKPRRLQRRELERLRETVRELTKSEDGRFEYKSRLRQIQDRLTQLRQRDKQHAHEVERLRAEVAVGLRDWATAVEAWSAVAESSPDGDPEAVAKLALAHAQIGNFPSAMRHVRSLGGRRSSDRRRVSKRVDGWIADHLVQSSHGTREAGDSDTAQALLEAGLVLQGFDIYEAREVSRVVSHVHSFRTGGSAALTSPVDSTKLELKVVPLFVSGFLYSGSGAIVDYLRDMPGISTEFTLQELGCFFGTYGPWKILHEDRTQIRLYASNFVLWSLLGIMPPFYSLSPTPKASLARLLPSASARDELRAIGLNFVAEVSEIESLSDEDLRGALSRALTRTLALATTPGDYLLLNNTIRPYQYELLDLLPNARAIAVLRDPRDQFVSQAVESSESITLEQFIEQTRQRMEAFSSYMSHGKSRDKVLRVQFEEFVTYADTRVRFLLDLGLAKSDLPSTSSFDATRSQRNIGIHKGSRWRREVNIIERELGDLIPKAAR